MMTDNEARQNLPMVTYWRNTQTGNVIWENNDWPKAWDHYEPATREDYQKQSKLGFRERQYINPPNIELLIHPNQNRVSRVVIAFDDTFSHGYIAYINYVVIFFNKPLKLDNVIPLSIEDIAPTAIRLMENDGFQFRIVELSPEYSVLSFTHD